MLNILDKSVDEKITYSKDDLVSGAILEMQHHLYMITDVISEDDCPNIIELSTGELTEVLPYEEIIRRLNADKNNASKIRMIKEANLEILSFFPS